MEATISEQTITADDYKPAIKELALTHNVSGYLYLRNGDMAVAFDSLDGTDFVLPLTVAHVYRQSFTETAYGQNWQLNINRTLKLNADDTEKNTRYVYTDELGDTHLFTEEYFYVEGSTKKQIDDKSQIKIEASGALTYNGRQVYKKQYCKGYTLIPEINDFKGCELIEQRIDERIAIEEYLLQTEPELKGYVRVYASSGELSANNVDFTVEGNFTQESYEAFLSGITPASDEIIIKATDLLMWSDKSRQVLTAAARQNLESVKYASAKYFQKKAELETLLMNTPVNYLRDGDGIINGFNANGNLVCVIDGYGNYVTVEYGVNGQIAAIYDSNGSAAEFAYEDGLLKTITDKLGRKIWFSYSQGQLKTVSFADDSTISFSYGSYGITGISTSECRYANISYSGGKASTVTRGSSSPRNGTIDTTNISYTTNGMTLSQTCSSESYTFRTDGRVATHATEDETKRRVMTSYTYSDYSNGYSVKTTTSDNAGGKYAAVTRSYDKADKITGEQTDRHKISDDTYMSSSVSYSYDNNDRLTVKRTIESYEIDSDPDNTETVKHEYVEKYKYDANGNLTLTESYVEGEEKTSGKNFEERVYNADGNVVKCIRWNSLDSSSKFYEEYECEKDGRVKYEKDETGAYAAMYEYADGRRTVNGITYADGGKIGYGRNPYNGKVTSVTQSTADGEANVNEITYNYGMPTQVTSGNTTLGYAYDHKGRKSSVTVNGATQWTCSYNDTYSYDSDDDEYHYSDSTQKIYTGSGDVNIVTTKYGTTGYDGIVQVSDSVAINGKFVYGSEYNSKGLEKRKIYYTEDNAARYVAYTYNEYDLLTRAQTTNQANGGTVISTESYGYDDYGKLSSKTITGAVTQTYYYSYKNTASHELSYVSFGGYNFIPLSDVNGRNTGREVRLYGDRIAGEYITYRKVGDHATNMPATVWYASGDKIADSIRYKYDSRGNISEIIKNGKSSVKYTYDLLNRLVKEENTELGKTVEFEYDTNGNIQRKTESGSAKEYEYDGDKLVSYNGKTCVYNNIGNPTTYKGTALTWQNGNRLTKYGSTTLAYDSLGRRTKSGSITFTYDNDGRLLKDNLYEFIYDASGLAGFKYSNALYFYRKDVQGNVIAILDASGTVKATYAYDAWGNFKVYDANGNVNNETAFIGNVNPFRYRGYYYDRNIKLYYLQTRYYDPETGRFISQDSVEYADPETINGLNLYAYCGNNPVMNIDPTGNAFITFLLILAGILLAGVINGVGAVINATEDENKWGAFLGGFVNGVISGVGIAAGIATGGVLGAVIAVSAGVLGGFFGDVISQKISYGTVEFAQSTYVGVVNGLFNLATFIGFKNLGVFNEATWLKRFTSTLSSSMITSAISIYLITLPIPYFKRRRLLE
ncbi:MAG: RHS repeat-associated core domain-containing protein [Clostridiales bacterium]|nr:RHS repeat-associated core domain-containing protein [Clostridiales bacterium]